jgi:CheY-like chemotaxis protein
LARKILLADDSVTAQNMGRKILTDAGYEVIAVNNGSAALKKIVEQKPDLIVLDVYMPGYSGLEVCQRIKENRETARIPVLLTVGKLEPFKPEEARRARADAFVVKPFEASELLSALAKLEEKIAPQPEPYKPGRFAKAIAALDEPEAGSTEKFGDSDGGWKSRLRFPGRKKQAEPEEAPEIPVPAKSVREFREEPFPAPVASVPAAAPEFERPMPAGIPRDITPEEIAAITAAAARLSGTASPAVEAETPSEAPVAERSEPAAVNTEAQASVPASSELAAAVPETVVTSDVGPITFASAPALAGETAAAEESSQEKIEEGRPAEAAPVVAETTPSMTDSVPAVTEAPPAVVQEMAVVAEPVPAELISEVSAPTSVAEQAAVALKPIAEVASETAAHPITQLETASTVQAEMQSVAPVEAVSEAAIPAASVSVPDVPTDIQPESAPVATTSEPVASEPVAPVASFASEPAPVPAAHDEEVMAALQNLIPAESSTNGAGTTQITSDVPANVVASVADFGPAAASAARPRWIAEEAVLTAEESMLSLEQEMEKAYAAFAASEAARMLATSTIDSLKSHSSPTAAMEVFDAPAVVEAQRAEDLSTPEPAPMAEFAPAIVPAVSDMPPLHAMASAAGAAEGSTFSSTTVIADLADGAHAGQAAVVGEPFPAESSTAQDASAALDTTAAVEPRAVVTNFVIAASAAADVVSQPEPATAASQPPVPVEPQVAPAAPTEMTLETISAGDEDSMAKNSESGLGFKMIRQSPAGTKAAASAAPVTKENFEPAAKAEPAAMAAAASAEAAPAVPPMPASAPDPRAIASIVDSVLAELRPKIVEEIAKKLAEPNK